jgi:hypothetical protein
MQTRFAMSCCSPSAYLRALSLGLLPPRDGAFALLSPYHAPIFAWLLLVSRWARQAAFLWAGLPLLAYRRGRECLQHYAFRQHAGIPHRRRPGAISGARDPARNRSIKTLDSRDRSSESGGTDDFRRKWPRGTWEWLVGSSVSWPETEFWKIAPVESAPCQLGRVTPIARS